MGARDRIGLAYAYPLVPFIEAIGDHETAASCVPGIAERRLGFQAFGPRIEGRKSELLVPRPGWDQTPAHGRDHALARTVQHNDRERVGRRKVPAWPQIGRDRVGLDPELYSQLGIIGDE